MKTIILILLLTITAHPLLAQETARERIEQRRKAEAAQNNINNSQNGITDIQLNEIIENSRWSRIIYRHIDLNNPVNGPLNALFPIIFKLLQNNSIKAYEYIDGHENFTEGYQINFTEFIDRFDIYHETGNGQITVHDSDIPSNEVQSYYIKEIYYFDTPTSSLRILPLSICPIIHRNDNYESTTRYPLFWIPYTQISHYMKQAPAMLSGINNSNRGTIDDFLRIRLYNGDIYKTGNSANLSIPQYTNSPEEMKAEQDRIEQELKDFENLIKQQEANLPSQSRQNNVNQNNTSGASQSMRNRRY